MQRVLRSKATGWVALALHISRLPAPAPRPHHRRIARAVLDDAAARQGGHFFPLGNGDMVLLWQASDAGTALAGTLARLFAIDAPDPNLLLTRWLLADGEGDAFLAYVDHAEQEAAARPAPTPAAPDPAPSVTAVDAMSDLVETARITDLLHRQTAVLIASFGQPRLLPLYREITFSVAVLEASVGASGQATADPFLFRHLAQRLDRRMLHALAEDLRGDGRLIGWAAGQGWPVLHLNLTLSAILSPAFAAFAAACRAKQAQVAIEVALLEACADPDAFATARDQVRAAGFGFVLDGVSHHALAMTTPAVLQPDLLKLEWSRRIPEAGPELAAKLAELGPDRLVLHRADTEGALRWGLAHGIRRFQGRHVDAMLAASRIEACPHSGICSLRQCIERESATSTAGRAGCRNLALLDAAAPGQSVAA